MLHLIEIVSGNISQLSEVVYWHGPFEIGRNRVVSVILYIKIYIKFLINLRAKGLMNQVIYF